jgi:hypothetical protein
VANDTLAKLSFVSALQRGLAAGVDKEDVFPRTDGEARTHAKVDLNFNNNQTANVDLALVGPGDIVGLDTRTIVRVYPRRDDNDAEFEHFAAVEFDQADLLWRYTPARATGSAAAKEDKLRPWLTLVVLQEGPEFKDTDLAPASPTQRLPILSVLPRYLPPTADLWAWGHLQLNEELTTATEDQRDQQLNAAIGGAHGRVLSRLMSPRILEKQKAYHAFLVPTFKRGLLAGLGVKPGDVDGLEPAWVDDPGDAVADPIRIPVYYEWRFQTGTAGSFESLASALLPRDLPATVGRRNLSVTKPGLGLPAAAADDMPLTGALQSVKASEVPGDVPPAPDWIIALKNFVDVSEMDARDVPTPPPPTPPPPIKVKVITPPLYGRWYAKQDHLDHPATRTDNPPWFFNLNSDARHRVGAALGTQVIQREQQSLMESAWQQADSLRAVNYERKVLQIGRESFTRLFSRHIRLGFLESQLSMTGKLHGRILKGNLTIYGHFARSALGLSFFDPQWRRFSSPRGVLGRRLGLPKRGFGVPPEIFGRINEGVLNLDPPPGKPRGANTPSRGWGGPVSGDGGPSDKEVEDLVNKLGKDQLVFWGLVFFWVSRHLLSQERGQYWWLLHKVLKFGLALLRLANDAQKAREKARQDLANETIDGNGVRGGEPQPNLPVREGIDIRNPGSLPPPPGLPAAPGTPDHPDAAQLREAAGKLMDYLRRQRNQPQYTKVNLTEVLTSLMDGLEPKKTFTESQKLRLTTVGVPFVNEDELEPIQAAPEFDRPMYLPLREISDEWILPGLSDVPADTVGLVLTNQKFVEAFMAGLNHEMTRELVWNEYPVDQRGTYFRQFWDTRGFIRTPDNDLDPEELKDIAPIHAWPATADLGDNTSRPTVTRRVVLLVRGQLIKRYPNVIVYAATKELRPADPGADPDYKEQHPTFHGFLGGDVAYYGFELQLDDVKDAGDPWFFVLQEQPAEPRFGLNSPSTDRFAKPTHFTGAKAAATVAAQGFRQPTRVVVHGSALVSPPGP